VELAVAGARRAFGWKVATAFVVLAAQSLFSSTKAAPPADDEEDPSWYEGTEATEAPAKETWASVFATRKTWAVTNGTTWAPTTTLQQDGIRLRLVSGVQGYRYTTTRHDFKVGDSVPVEHWGLARSIDLLAGYQWSAGRWTLKAFGGVHNRAAEAQSIDPEVSTKLKALGARGVFEAWFNMGDTAWAALDLGYTTVNSTYSSRLRAAWQPAPHWSLGPEVHAIGNRDGTNQRLGAFLRFDNGWHELSAAVGYDRATGQPTAPYATVQWMYRF
jgi:hypothetical protein